MARSSGNQKLRELIGKMKDKASQSRAALSKRSLHLSLLRATSHDPHEPPSDRHLDALLSSGNGSRASSSVVIMALMDRLNRTADSSVAIKCLAAVHRVVTHGGFILRDQLSLCSAAGGRNHLNLSAFRDASTPASWVLSCWVRWFAQYVEHLMCTSRVLGFFLCSSSDLERERNREAMSSLSDSELLNEIDCLVGLIEEMGRRPDSCGNKTVVEIVGVVDEDCVLATNEISVRLGEFRQRFGQLGFAESLELICLLKRLEKCREMMKETEAFWGSILETKEIIWRKIGLDDGEKDRGRFLKRDELVGRSVRFHERVLRSGDLGRFTSARIGASVSLRFPIQRLYC